MTVALTPECFEGVCTACPVGWQGQCGCDCHWIGPDFEDDGDDDEGRCPGCGAGCDEECDIECSYHCDDFYNEDEEFIHDGFC